MIIIDTSLSEAKIWCLLERSTKWMQRLNGQKAKLCNHMLTEWCLIVRIYYEYRKISTSINKKTPQN